MAKRKHQRGDYLTSLSKLSHASNRLEERYGNISFYKISNHILKSRNFKILDEDDLGAICLTNFNNVDIYFVLHTRYRGEEIATFLTVEMANKALEEKCIRRLDGKDD